MQLKDRLECDFHIRNITFLIVYTSLLDSKCNFNQILATYVSSGSVEYAEDLTSDLNYQYLILGKQDI